MSEATDLNPFDPAFIACPFPAYTALRDSAPVVHVPHGKGFWFVTRHDLVREVVGDPVTFSSQVGSLSSVVPGPELAAEMARIKVGSVPNIPTLLTLDPPGHTRNRHLVSHAFTPRAVRAYEPLVRAICRELLDGWRDGEVTDFVSRFAVPLPVRVIAHGLDVPGDRVDDFKRWSDAAVAFIGSHLNDEESLAAARSDVELQTFLLDQIEAKRATPGEDLISRLVHARLSDEETSGLAADAARQLSDAEIVSIVRQLLVAGNETTTNLLTQTVVRLADEPRWWARLRDEPELIGPAVEESLRLVSPSGVNQRRTTRQVDLGGVTIPAGADVLVVYLSANHDERVFAEPERFDPTRANLGDHLAFGRGIHFCPGASLARLEARVALEELTSAVAGYRLADRDHLAWNDSFQLRAIRALPIVPTMGAATRPA